MPTYLKILVGRFVWKCPNQLARKKRLLCIYLDFKFEIESKLIRTRAKRGDESARWPSRQQSNKFQLHFKFEIESKVIRTRAKREDESPRRPSRQHSSLFEIHMSNYAHGVYVCIKVLIIWLNVWGAPSWHVPDMSALSLTCYTLLLRQILMSYFDYRLIFTKV